MITTWFTKLKIKLKMLLLYIIVFTMISLVAAAGVITLLSTRTVIDDMIDEIHYELDQVLEDSELYDEQMVGIITAADDMMDDIQEEAERLVSALVWIPIAAGVIFAVLLAFLALYATGSITQPIKKLSEATEQVAEGQLNVKLDITHYGEIGALAENLENVIMIIRVFIRDLRGLDHAFRIDGDTSERIDVSAYKGAYAEVAAAINDILDYHVLSKKEILECISKIVSGDYDAPLRKFPGLESQINEAVDYLRISVRAMGQLMKQKTDAELASQAKSSFLANMSHEIRTPMNAIIGVTEMLMDSEELPESMEQGLLTIYNSSNLLLGIINDILDFSKIEAGKMDIIPAQYEVASLINDAAQLNIMRIESRAINFELEINENIPAKLIGDELRIKEILNNLLSNAFKYTNDGKVTLAVDFKTEEDAKIAKSSEKRVTLVLEVRDTGYGMTEEQIDGLFTEYSRYNQQVSQTIEGTGLGLAITKRLIDLMDGDVDVESEPGKGSKFTVWLPQITVDDEILGSEVAEGLRKFRLNYIAGKKRQHTIRDPMPYGSVLIVDDVEPNLYVAEGIMKLYKLQIDTAMSGRAAIEKIKSGKVYDVIFMDHMMPEMDGVEATKVIREMGYKEPIVALTANAVAGQAEILLRNGFDDFVSKPVDARRLNTVLNRLIRDKQPPEVVEEARKQAEAAHANGKDTALNPALSRNIKAMSDNVYGLDLQKGLDKFGGDEAGYIKTLRAYVSSISTMLDSIKSVDKESLNKYRITVHGIKGASFDIFANTAGKMAESLEFAAEAGDIEHIAISNPTFIYTVRKLITNIQGLLEEVDEENPKPRRSMPEKETMRRLFKACKAFNMQTVESVMEEIDRYRYDIDGDLIDKLRELVGMAKFKQAEQLLAENGYGS